MAKSIKPPSRSKVRRAVAVLQDVRREWLGRPGVNAVDVGFKIRSGELQQQVAVRAHVERKRPPEQLSAEDVFNVWGEARQQDGVAIDVIEASYAPAATTAVDTASAQAIQAVDRKARIEPLLGGISCGGKRTTAGTLGVVVYDLKSGKPMVLSNWHVLAGSSAARPGEAILQPGPMDGGRLTDSIATLARMQLDSRMDAAVAVLDGSREASRDILGLMPVSGTRKARLGMKVVKSGRTTGLTEGIVDGIAMSVKINYGDPGLVTFHDQIRIVPPPPWPDRDVEVSRGGDSGSVWLEEGTGRVIGLHFAGENDPLPAAENALCNPIRAVADELGFSFFPVLVEPPNQDPGRDPVPDPRLPDPSSDPYGWLAAILAMLKKYSNEDSPGPLRGACLQGSRCSECPRKCN